MARTWLGPGSDVAMVLRRQIPAHACRKACDVCCLVCVFYSLVTPFGKKRGEIRPLTFFKVFGCKYC